MTFGSPPGLSRRVSERPKGVAVSFDLFYAAPRASDDDITAAREN